MNCTASLADCCWWNWKLTFLTLGFPMLKFLILQVCKWPTMYHTCLYMMFILYITYLLYHILQNCTAKTWLICYFSFPLAAILIFNCSKRFKVCHHIQNKSPYHYTPILKISCFYAQNARFYDFWQLSKWTKSNPIQSNPIVKFKTGGGVDYINLTCACCRVLFRL